MVVGHGIREHRNDPHGRLLNVSTSGYYKHRERSSATELTDRAQRRADSEVKILSHHKESGGL